MNNQISKRLLLISVTGLLLLCLNIEIVDAFYGSGSNVVQLTPNNFKSKVFFYIILFNQCWFSYEFFFEFLLLILRSYLLWFMCFSCSFNFNEKLRVYIPGCYFTENDRYTLGWSVRRPICFTTLPNPAGICFTTLMFQILASKPVSVC